MQEIKQQTYTTTIKLFFFYILFPFYIGFIINKFIQSENNIELVYNESFYLNFSVVISMVLFNLFKWLEVPSTENQKDKGYRIYGTGGKSGAGGTAGEDEGKAEGAFSDDL